MLKNLIIKNYALIRELEISPSKNLNIITGETGAGKSIMLGAIGLLLGNRADSKMLFDEEKKCVIEGVFKVKGYKLKGVFKSLDLDYEELSVIRREISPSGKSRAFINDTPVNLETLRAISSRLLDVHSQHDNLLIGSEDYQLQIIDVYAETAPLLSEYEESYKAFKAAEKAYQQLMAENEEIKKEFDYNSHLLNELTEAGLDDLDIPAMESELELLENAESIKSNLNGVLEFLSNAEFSVEAGLKSAMAALSQISGYGKQFEELQERTQSIQIELQDITLELEKEESKLFPDQERMMQLKEQVDQVYSLQHKHHVHDIEELIALRDSIQEKVDRVLNFDDKLSEYKAEKEQAYAVASEKAKLLSEKRMEFFNPLVNELNLLLQHLGMPNGKTAIDHREGELTKSGKDEVNILFSANKGVKPESIKAVASGGEFSRLMLAIKYILARKTLLPTVIFDEIDTGISGEIAIKVGNMMKEMAGRHQIIAISHLPQIAAKGDHHYFVFKDNSAARTVSRIKLLAQEERLNEIAQMIGGANPSETAYKNAQELME